MVVRILMEKNVSLYGFFFFNLVRERKREIQSEFA